MERNNEMQACLAVMGWNAVEDACEKNPAFPGSQSFLPRCAPTCIQSDAPLCFPNPEPVVGDNKALGEMSLNLTPMASSEIWWSKERSRPYFAQGKVMCSLPWERDVFRQLDWHGCWIWILWNLISAPTQGHVSREWPLPVATGPAFYSTFSPLGPLLPCWKAACPTRPVLSCCR